jgi:hypothetical protein
LMKLSIFFLFLGVWVFMIRRWWMGRMPWTIMLLLHPNSRSSSDAFWSRDLE